MPYIRSIVQGETFFEEIIIKDSDGDPIDLSSVTKSIQCSGDLDEADFSLSDGSDTGSIEIRADRTNTENWDVGVFSVRIWLDWGASADIEHEIIHEIQLHIEAAFE